MWIYEDRYLPFSLDEVWYHIEIINQSLSPFSEGEPAVGGAVAPFVLHTLIYRRISTAEAAGVMKHERKGQKRQNNWH